MLVSAVATAPVLYRSVSPVECGRKPLPNRTNNCDSLAVLDHLAVSFVGGDYKAATSSLSNQTEKATEHGRLYLIQNQEGAQLVLI